MFVKENIVSSLHADFPMMLDTTGEQKVGYRRYIPSTVTVIEDFEFEITSESSKTVAVVKYTGSASNVTIPSTVSTAVIGTDTVFVVGSDYTVTSIADGADSASGAFANKATLRMVTLPSTLTGIGNYAFYNCSGLTGSLGLPSGLTYIGSHAFYNCSGLTGALTLPAGVPSIRILTFYNTGFTKLQFASGSKLTSLGYESFRESSLAEIDFTNATALTEIGHYSFYGCQNLTDVKVPNTVVHIRESAFNHCENLEEVGIGTNVTNIETNAFANCSSLTTVLIDSSTIASGLTSASVYGGLIANADTVYIKTGMTPASWFSSNYSKLDSTDQTGYDMYIKGELITDFQFTDNGTAASLVKYTGSASSVTIPSTISKRVINGETYYIVGSDLTVTSIASASSAANGAFYNKTAVKGVTLPSGMATIGNYAFYGAGLESISFPSTVTSIGDSAFYGCSGLTGTLTLPARLTYIGSHAFYNCSGLTGTLTLPAGVPSIRILTFYNTGFTKLQFASGSSLTSLGYESFRESSLAEIDFTNATALTEIGHYAFYGCTGLTDVKVPNTVVHIRESAFNHCENLEEVGIGTNVTNIETNAFANCSSLTTVFIDSSTIASGLTSATACGNILANADTIYIKTGLTPASWFSSNYSKLDSSDQAGYDKYIQGQIYTDFEFSDDGTNASLVKYTGSASSVTIPSTISKRVIDGETYYVVGSDLTVTSIASASSVANGAFCSAKGTLQSITLPNTLTIIGDYAFYYCTGLNGTLTIPASVTEIGKMVFAGCNGISRLTFESGSKLQTIGGFAFSTCRGLTGILTIPASVTMIDDSAFGYCVGLTGLSFASGSKLEIMGDNVFQNCSGLTGAVTIPASVTEMGWAVFSDCVKLQRVNFESGSKLVAIGNNAFNGCTGLTQVVIPSMVKNIGPNAFAGCSSLAMVFIDSSTIASGLTSASVYGGLIANADIVYIKTGLTPASWLSANYSKLSTSDQTGYDMYIKGELITDFQFTDNGATASLVKYTGSASSVTIPSTISKHVVGSTAYYIVGSDLAVTSIASASSAANGAFYNKTAVKGVTLPSGMTTIGNYAFYGAGLESISFPSTVSSIGDGAFYGCGLTGTLTLPTSLTYLGQQAFYNCSGLTGTLTIPAGITQLRLTSFYNCTGLTKLQFASGSKLASIGYQAFLQCSGLAEIDFTNATSLTEIGHYAFQNCTSLTNVTLPSSVLQIRQSAFAGCSNLSEVRIGNNVTLIETDAFTGCTSLATVYIDSSSVASQLSSTTACGNILANADTVYIKTGMTPASWFSSNYSKLSTSDQTGYDMYIKGQVYTDFQFRDSGTTASLVKYTGSASSVTIPSTISKRVVNGTTYYLAGSDLTVTSIANGSGTTNGAFYAARSTLQNVTLPSALTQIGAYAFYGCNKLTSIDLPSTLTQIGAFAFYGCSKLTDIDLPASVTSIAQNAFTNCSSLESVSIPSNSKLQNIGIAAFLDCSSLQSIRVPSTMNQISTAAFNGCTSLKTVTIDAPNIVSSLNEITDCGDLINYADVVYLEGNAAGLITTGFLQLFTEVVSEINLYYKYINNASIISDFEFTIDSTAKTASVVKYTGSATSVTIPSTISSAISASDYELIYIKGDDYKVTTIADATSSSRGAFYAAMSTLQSVTLPNTLTRIGDYAFYFCYRITSIIIPSSVISIGEYSFNMCYGLNSITFEPNSKLQTIEAHAFDNCFGLETITIPSTVTSIGDYAFNGCSVLNEITFAEGSVLETIGNSAFNGAKITSITIPSEVTSIGTAAFSGCTNLAEVYIDSPDIAASITSASASGGLLNYAEVVYVESGTAESYLRSYFTNLYTKITSDVSGYSKFVDLGSVAYDFTFSINSADNTAAVVKYTGSDTNVVIPSSIQRVVVDGVTYYIRGTQYSVTSIADGSFDAGAFSSVQSTLRSVTIPSTITYIGDYAFQDCTLLSGDIADMITNVTQIGMMAFRNTAISGYISSPRLIVIGEQAFYGCTELTGISLSQNASLEGIGNYAFSDCTGMTTIALPGSLITIGAGAFSGCSNAVFERLDYYETSQLESIGESAFSGCSKMTIFKVPSTVTFIGDFAFSGCTSLTSVYIDSVDVAGGLLSTSGYSQGSILAYATDVNIISTATSYLPSGFFDYFKLRSSSGEYYWYVPR